MAGMLETPSRIWRRIEAVEDREMPSLPSMPRFEDSGDEGGSYMDSKDEEDLEGDISAPIHSTPTVALSTTTARNTRLTSSTRSSARFANSIASRSSKSSLALSSSRSTTARTSGHESFDASIIPSLPAIQPGNVMGHIADGGDSDLEDESRESVPDVYLPPVDGYDNEDEDVSLTEALRSVSRAGSPPQGEDSYQGVTPKKSHDYSVSLRSEPRPSPLDRYRNVALRKTTRLPGNRTPSLTRTSSSPGSSPTHSTPHSSRSFGIARSNTASPIPAANIPLPRSLNPSPAINHSHVATASPLPGLNIPLPRSRTASPAVYTHDSQEDLPSISESEQSVSEHGMRSMDITDVHISPQVVADIAARPREYSETTDEGESADHREPTFSSEGSPDVTPYAPAARYVSTTQLSSPATSIAFTPTPAFPRPRARFDLPPPPADLLATSVVREDDEDSDDVQETPRPPSEEPPTPRSRRRSFFLAVINSTARPRIKAPTPHPRRGDIFATPSLAESTPSSGSASSVEPPSALPPRANLQTAFAGVTPRPRLRGGPRPSHPLSQTIVPSQSYSDSESQSPNQGSSIGENRHVAWATPAPAGHSPYDGAGDRASFISTASSHDLTTHQRANTSFDPAMGFGLAAHGQGVGRFNATKLNNYLHGLNRRLQEENETLMARIRALEDKDDDDQQAQSTDPSSESRRSSLGSLTSRRVSLGGTPLNDVAEDVSGEGWVEEKAALEELVQTCRDELAMCVAEKDELQTALEEEKNGREVDRERWKDRMTEVMGPIIKELKTKVENAEKNAKDIELDCEDQLREMEKKVNELQTELELTASRAEKAESALESGMELGGELKHAHDEIRKVTNKLREANEQIKESEVEVLRSQDKVITLERKGREGEDHIQHLEDELHALGEEINSIRDEANSRIQQLEDELHASGDYVAELEAGANAAAERIENLEEELGVTLDKNDQLSAERDEATEKAERLQNEIQKNQEIARQMEEALDTAEQKMLADEGQMADLKNKVTLLEREKEKQREISLQMSMTSSSSAPATWTPGPTDEDVDALEKELGEAHKEIARLNMLLNQSPARKAMDKAKEAKIEMLEREREELLERNKALRMAVTEINTPGKVINTSNISPIHRQVLSMSMKVPRTPGAPLREMSWLNTTIADSGANPYIQEISRLQRELDRANESIDEKLDKLEDAGLGVVGLTRKLEDARSRISSLQDDIARLTRKDERRNRRLQRVRCQKCHVRVDLSPLTRSLEAEESSIDLSRGVAEPPTPSTRTTETLRVHVQTLNTQLDTLRKQWDEERQALLGEKAVLQDATKRLNAEVKEAKAEAKKAAENGKLNEKSRAGIQVELDRAKLAIADLENDLKAERSMLRGLTAEQSRVSREKADVNKQLQRTESDIEDIKRHLQKLKKENQGLENELRTNVTAEQRVRALEGRVTENLHIIEQLRQERSLLVADHKDLQQHFLDITEQANRLREEYTTSSNIHENRRQQLDLHAAEIDELRQALSDKAEELHRAESEKDKLEAEKNDVARTVASLERDLRRVKADAEAFGRDLRLLRTEKEILETKHKEELVRAERTKRQIQTQLRLLSEQLETQKEKTSRAREELQNHVCAADEGQVLAVKQRHKVECKGLITQINYLKAKYTRENAFRSDLTYQKNYLLVLLSRYEKSEQTIFASIAKIGFPIAPPPVTKKPRKLKNVALSIIFASRAKRASDKWRAEQALKPAIAAALQDVRQRRAVTAT